LSRELGDKDLGSGMSFMLDLILNRPCLVSPFLCFVCSFGAVTSLSEDREMGKASDGWSTSCSMSVIKSGGNQGKAKRLCPFTSFKERILKAADSS